MISAREMFESLGYEYYESESSIRYLANYDIPGEREEIGFYKHSHRIFTQYNYEGKDITMDEFKAIQQQLKELGWI